MATIWAIVPIFISMRTLFLLTEIFLIDTILEFIADYDNLKPLPSLCSSQE
jgi:hypothetical protein